MANIGDLYITGIKPVVSTALEANHRLSATGPGVLYYLNAQNYNLSGRLVLLIDSSSATAPTTATGLLWAGVLPAAQPAGNNPVTPKDMVWDVPPMQFINGLWVVLSTILTTPFTIAAATADGFFSAMLQTS